MNFTSMSEKQILESLEIVWLQLWEHHKITLFLSVTQCSIVHQLYIRISAKQFLFWTLRWEFKNIHNLLELGNFCFSFMIIFSYHSIFVPIGMIVSFNEMLLFLHWVFMSINCRGYAGYKDPLSICFILFSFPLGW